MRYSVLICDDSLIARKQVAKSLPQDWDVDVHFAKHGEDALDQIVQGKGQILLLDLNMPILDGYETLEAIVNEGHRTKTIVISGDIQPEAHQRVLALGALDFIHKPVNSQDLKAVLAKHQLLQHDEAEETSELPYIMRDCYQEITNVAMGQAGDHLARIMNVFVKLPIPNVNLIEVAEIHMMLSDIEQDERVSSVCQSFVGGGVSGEAVCILSDSSFGDVAKILNIDKAVDDQIQLEVLMDAASILIGTCLRGIAEQLDIHLRQGQPMVLGQHRNVGDLIANNQHKWRKTLAIEISYGIEGYDVQCDLVLLFSEESMLVMNKKLDHLLEDVA
jgi:CheY-like chemotaxis protein